MRPRANRTSRRFNCPREFSILLKIFAIAQWLRIHRRQLSHKSKSVFLVRARSLASSNWKSIRIFRAWVRFFFVNNSKPLTQESAFREMMKSVWMGMKKISSSWPEFTDEAIEKNVFISPSWTTENWIKLHVEWNFVFTGNYSIKFFNVSRSLDVSRARENKKRKRRIIAKDPGRKWNSENFKFRAPMWQSNWATKLLAQTFISSSSSSFSSISWLE